QGGGGGTGSPYGISGAAGIGNLASVAGGFGGGSGGGEEANPFITNTLIEEGGGGGGFGTEGIGGGQSSGVGINGGLVNGGRFLVPLAGGSGGGAGNSNELGDGDHRASGGGGGGAIEIVAFDSIVLNNSLLAARGDSGQSGIKIAAGGGGGSGGGIYLASTAAIVSSALPVAVFGGAAGHPAADSIGYEGGSGGLGRVRIDGAANFQPPSFFANVWVNGLSLQSARAPTIRNDSMLLSGIDPDRANLTDAIRIFYRTPHSAWQSSDTQRDSTGAWSKWVPLLHDSLLYVVAMAEVSAPAQGLNGPVYEPSWLVSSAAMGRTMHPATPFLVTLDSLNFGTVQQGHCKTLVLVLSNKGAAPLSVTPNSITGSTEFSLMPDTTLFIAPYRSDTVRVTFCADSVGLQSARLTFLSNDSGNSPHLVSLSGAGLKRNDSLSITPAILNFGAVRIDSCASDTLLLRSLGSDTLYLDSSEWQRGPFAFRVVPSDTALPHNATAKLIVTFCPTDSGDVSVVLTLDDREDSILVRGIGILRQAAVASGQNLGSFCRGQIAFFDTIYNRGNDTISVRSWAVDSGSSHALNLLLQPGTVASIPLSFIENRTGPAEDTVRFELADTSLASTIQFQVFGPSLGMQSSLRFPFRCLGTTALDSVAIANSGPDTIQLADFRLSDTDYVVEDSTQMLAPQAQFALHLHFVSADTLPHFDTLRFIASDHGCDSTFAVALEAQTIDSGLAASAVDFGTIPIDSCAIDSTLVQNPCGPEVTIDSVFIGDKAIQWVIGEPAVIPSDSSRFFVFRYCPETDSITLADTAILFNGDQALLRIPLLGKASALGFPYASFTVSSATVPADSIATTVIRLDSLSLKGTHSVRGVLSFDPEVVEPETPMGFPHTATRVAADSLAFTATLDSSSAPSVIESINWRALVGPRSSTIIEFTLTTDVPLAVHSNNGTIAVTDCTGLNGSFASAGSYTISPVNPNPSSDEASVSVTLGYAGYVQAGLYDMTGREVEPILSQSMPEGTNAIAIPMHSISSGKYFFVIHTLGWEASEPVVIAH
ncbi:MAG TPA: choice-of-anchor D domain-containing protein, partial [Candidatus Kapabacteria bacterium]